MIMQSHLHNAALICFCHLRISEIFEEIAAVDSLKQKARELEEFVSVL